jgi:methylase of polypeptide subunit release factors
MLDFDHTGILEKSTMHHAADVSNTTTILGPDLIGSLSELHINHPGGTFSLTPASFIAIRTVAEHQRLFSGVGIDWGCGTGCLALLAARIEAVRQVIGLDISAANVAAARQNAQVNGLAHKTRFFLADSYLPFAAAEQEILGELRGKTDFILSNPPSSDGDDGFEFRRIVLRGARQFLAPGGVVALNISYQYGKERIARLSEQISGFCYEGLLSSSDWVPFDLARADLRQCLADYAQEEARGGVHYTFLTPGATDEGVTMNAQTAVTHFQQTGQSPLTRWQTHLFRYLGDS